MDVDLEFCLIYFAHEQLTSDAKQIVDLEYNMQKRKHKKHVEKTNKNENFEIAEESGITVEQILQEFHKMNISINEARHMIEENFRNCLFSLRADLVSSMEMPCDTYIEKLRMTFTRLRQQIASVDSEIVYLFHMIDNVKVYHCSENVSTWLLQRYGYLNEINWPNNSLTSTDFLTFSHKSSFIQLILHYISLSNQRKKLFNMCIEQISKDFIFYEKKVASYYHQMTILNTLESVQDYLEHLKQEINIQKQQIICQMNEQLEKKRFEQKMRAIELINALCQLSIDFRNQYKLRKQLRKIFLHTKDSKQFVPILIDYNGAAAAENLTLTIRIDTDSKEWISNTKSFEHKLCFELSTMLQLPKKSIKIAHIEEDNTIIHVMIHPRYNQLFMERIIQDKNNNESLMANSQAIENFCKNLNCRLFSIVIGKCALSIEKYFMGILRDELYMKGLISTGTMFQICLLSQSDDQATCPKGWKRFSIQVAEVTGTLNSKWNTWPIVYLGTRSVYAPFILTSGFRVSNHQRDLSMNYENIHFSTNIEYSAHPKYTHVWKKRIDNTGKCQYYQLVFQCRINPSVKDHYKSEKLPYDNPKKIEADNKSSSTEFEWTIPINLITRKNVHDNVICDSLMVRTINNETKDCEALTWWNQSCPFFNS